MSSCDKSRNKPFVKLVHSLQIHVVRKPHVLIYEVKSSMGNELVEMAMIILMHFQKTVISNSVKGMKYKQSFAQVATEPVSKLHNATYNLFFCHMCHPVIKLN